MRDAPEFPATVAVTTSRGGREWAVYLALSAALVTALFWFVLIQGRAHVADPFRLDIFRHLILFHDYYLALPFLGILLAALLPPLRQGAFAAADWCGRHAGVVAALVAAVLALGARFAYHAHPLSMDEYVPVFQSGAFARGRLAGQFPVELLDWLIPQEFRGHFLKADRATGEVVGAYWPGFALLLAPFSALGVAWLLNPLLGGITVIVAHRLALGLFGSERAAGLTVLLTIASPAVTINAMSFYSMPAHLVANGLYALLLIEPTPRKALLAGVVGSFALVLHNPVPHLLFALPWLAWLATRPERFRLLFAICAGYLPLGLVLGLGWAVYYRSVAHPMTAVEIAAYVSPFEMAWRSLSGQLRWPTEELLTARLLAFGKLWLWAAPALVAAAFLGLWHACRKRGAWLALAACGALTFAGYLFVPHDQGHGWGYRYFHSAWLVLPLLAVAATQWPGGSTAARSEALSGYLAACAALSLAVMTPLQVNLVERFLSRHLAQMPVAQSGEPRVRIIDRRGGYYVADLVQNDPFLGNPVKTLMTQGAERDAAMMAAQFPRYRLLGADHRGSVWGIPADDPARRRP